MDKDDSLEFGLTNVEASFGDGTSDFVTLSEGSGALLSMPNGVALQASGNCEHENSRSRSRSSI